MDDPLPLLQFSSSELSPQLLVPSHCKKIGMFPQEHWKTSALLSVKKDQKGVSTHFDTIQANNFSGLDEILIFFWKKSKIRPRSLSIATESNRIESNRTTVKSRVLTLIRNTS